MKKAFLLLLSLFLCLGVLSACSAQNGANSLSTEEKEAAIQKAQGILTLLHEGNVSELFAQSNEAMQAAVTETAWDSVISQCSAFGAFVEFEKAETALLTQKDLSYLTVVQLVKYENKTLQYTISFDADGKLAGFYFK